MTILVTAASGHLGRLVVESLLARGADPADVVASARDISKLEELAARGIRTVELDYTRPETIAPALEGVDAVLLVSGTDFGNRVPQHQNVIDAAKAAGVAKLVYTSAPRATEVEAEFALAREHAGTERAIAESGVPAVILRNNWYTENYTADVALAADTGVIASSAGDGRVASATRADYAEAAAVVLLEDEHVGEVYELAGDAPWTYDELASAAAEIVGREVVYTPLTTEARVASLEGAGLDAATAGVVAGIDDGIRRGILAQTDGTLARLIGRPTTPLVEGLRAAIGVTAAAA